MQSKLSIFYDGGCKVCAWEVDKYLKIDAHQRLATIDINAPDFAAEKYGLDRIAVRKYFHVLTQEGRVISGVDAFIEIWKTLDTKLARRAVRLARISAIHRLLDLGYEAFVIVRPYLPRNQPACDDGGCSIDSKHKVKNSHHIHTINPIGIKK